MHAQAFCNATNTAAEKAMQVLRSVKVWSAGEHAQLLQTLQAALQDTTKQCCTRYVQCISQHCDRDASIWLKKARCSEQDGCST